MLLLATLAVVTLALLTLSGCAGQGPAERQAQDGIVGRATRNGEGTARCSLAKVPASRDRANITFSDDFAELKNWTLVAPDTPGGEAVQTAMKQVINGGPI
jgi:hypothetical protein